MRTDCHSFRRDNSLRLCRLFSYPLHDPGPNVHAMFFSLPKLLLTKMPVPPAQPLLNTTVQEAMSTEYEYYDQGITDTVKTTLTTLFTQLVLTLLTLL